MKSLLVYFFISIPLSVFSQNIKTEINGEWVLCGSSKNLFASDTIILHCDITYAEVKRCCNVLKIDFLENDKLRMSDVTRCEEPGTVQTFDDAKSYRLSRRKNSWILTIFIGKKQLHYIVVDFYKQEVLKYPFEIRILKILKI